MVRSFRVCLLTVLLIEVTFSAVAQDRFESLDGYERFRTTSRQMNTFVRGGSVSSITWAPDGSAVYYKHGDEWHRFDFDKGEATPVEEDAVERAPAASDDSGQRRRGPGRGRQHTTEPSPDEKWIAKHEDWNLRIYSSDESTVIPVTTDGHSEFKYATGSWVYGEELRQNSAMWWSPDSTKIAFYEFNEANVEPYHLVTGLTEVQTKVMTEWYPKAGAPNPIVGLLVFDMESRKITRVEIGDDTEQYVYNIRWSPDGTELLFNRTNRLQNVLDVMAAHPDTGKTRTIVTETQRTWQQNSPHMQFLSDGERFVWETEKSGWKHYELRHIDGSLLHPLTSGDFACDSIVDLDEASGWMYFTAYSSETAINKQLHRVRLDGTQQSRLTVDDLSHTTISIAPDDSHFIATAESIETPPTTFLYDTQGNKVATIAQSDTSGLNGRPMPEMITLKADDGETDLYGVLFKPSDFDPNKTYPLLVEVYGGPWSQTVPSRFRAAHPYCELGFIIAKVDNRGTPNRGKAFEDAAYQQLGIVDMKDQADAVRHLAQRPYIDGNRVGITGHSYGGYMAALAVLKYPDVFHVAVAGASVTDWRNYDTIYTERFMRTPQENPEGYEAGSCLTYADQLEGDLLLLHGMVDDNVHPANVFQLIEKLHEHNKAFEFMPYPTSGHGFRSQSANRLKWEFLVEHLIEKPD